MLEPEIALESLAAESDADAAELADETPASRTLDAESLFALEIGEEGLLTRAEEQALATRITQARRRVRSVLGRARRLTRAALADRRPRRCVAGA